jgi:hypothetical protein
MTSREKIESYLLKLSLSFEKAGSDSWIVRDADKGMDNLLVMLADPLVIMRINVMGAPREGREKLFEELLKLNATDMSHGAYALDGNNIIIVDTLEVDTLDLAEFEASFDAIGLALAQHLRILSKYHAKA